MTFRYVLSYCLTACVCAISAFAILMKLTSDVGRKGEVRAFRACVISLIVFDLSNALWIWSNHGFYPCRLELRCKSSIQVLSVFVLIIEHQHLKSPDSLIRTIRTQLAREVRAAYLPYTFTCSVGYAVCISPNADIDELTKRADARLYEDKKLSRSRIISIAPRESS